MRHKIHNISTTFEPKRPYSETRQNKRKQQLQVFPLKIHAWLGRVEITIKQKIKKTLLLANKKAVKRDEYNTSWTRILLILLYLRYTFAISSRHKFPLCCSHLEPRYQPMSEPETPHVIPCFQSSCFRIHGQSNGKLQWGVAHASTYLHIKRWGKIFIFWLYKARKIRA